MALWCCQKVFEEFPGTFCGNEMFFYLIIFFFLFSPRFCSCQFCLTDSHHSANLVQLSELPQVDCLLITQDFDDHCHLKTLKPLSAMYPDLRVISTPNAREKLDPLFSNVSTVHFNLKFSSCSRICIIQRWLVLCQTHQNMPHMLSVWLWIKK